VTRAAISEIEQYNRVALRIQPGVMVAGHAVSDVVHLLAELIENATVFSASDSRVLVSVQELASGGVLIQVSDSGVGVSDTRLAEMNRRLDDPPPIDESISRHMGLYAVARLAERHGVRVRLRAGNPQGLTALVWLPDSLAERGGQQYGDLPQRLAAFEARRVPGQHANPAVPASPAFPAIDSRVASGQPDAYAPVTRTATGPSYALQATGQTLGHATAQPAGPGASNWFNNRRAAGSGEAYGGGAGVSPPPESAWSPPAASWASGQQAAEIAANPVRGDRTVAGMPVREPRANLVPGSAGGGQRAAASPAGGYQEQTAGGLPQRSAERPPERSAETARSRLTGFQRGARRAEDQASHAGERADR
jgi:hypothetical protein